MSDRTDEEPLGRRRFLGIAGLTVTGLVGAGALAGSVRLLKPYVLPEPSRRFSIGEPAGYPPGTEKVLPERNVLVRSTPAGVAVLSLVCTHLGCIVTVLDRGFDCPCHGSRFARDGAALEGPAPRGLRWLFVSRAPDGDLLVDENREVPAGTFFDAGVKG